MPRKTETGPGFDPEDMTLPTMDRPSVVFAWFMDGMVVENRDQTGKFDPVLACAACGDHVLAIDDGDSLRVIFNTALSHRC